MPESAMIWNLVLSGFAGAVVWWIRGVNTRLDDARTLISKTREEFAKEYARRDEVERDMQKLMDRFDKIETKLDNMLERIK
ncbi:MAG: hypothetical protein VW518_01135 [Burkholderiaceae bacterium]